MAPAPPYDQIAVSRCLSGYNVARQRAQKPEFSRPGFSFPMVPILTRPLSQRDADASGQCMLVPEAEDGALGASYRGGSAGVSGWTSRLRTLTAGILYP